MGLKTCRAVQAASAAAGKWVGPQAKMSACIADTHPQWVTNSQRLWHLINGNMLQVTEIQLQQQQQQRRKIATRICSAEMRKLLRNNLKQRSK